jgi:ERCC4-type nuclease
MKIILDNRESPLYEKCAILLKISKKEELILSKEVLSLGDISIQTNEGTDIILIERKSIQDLLASIKDGRYEEQSHRLIHSSGIPRHNIQYLIEGSISFLNPAEKKIVFSAITSLSVFKGFSVLRTTSLQESADYIVSMCDKINREMNKGKLLFYFNPSTKCTDSHNSVKIEDLSNNSIILPTHSSGDTILIENDIVSTEHIDNLNVASENIRSYSEFVKKVKRDNITPDNIGEILLCQIPGISSVSAQAIMKKFDGSFANLVQEIQTNPDSLKDIHYGKDGKIRKINRTCGENIIKYLCNATSPEN